MPSRMFATLAATSVLVLAACTSGGAVSPGASACRETTEAGAVFVGIGDFEFRPQSIEATVGQVIAFINTGFEHHNATLDGGGCATRTLGTDETDGIVFTVAGRYPFSCTVHEWMTGTITVGG